VLATGVKLIIIPLGLRIAGEPAMQTTLSV
jgi:hypothetical protein